MNCFRSLFFFSNKKNMKKIAKTSVHSSIFGYVKYNRNNSSGHSYQNHLTITKCTFLLKPKKTVLKTSHKLETDQKIYFNFILVIEQPMS